MVNIKSLTLRFSEEHAVVNFDLMEHGAAQVVFAPAVGTGNPEDKFIVSAPSADMDARLRWVADRVIAAAIAAAVGEAE